MQTSWHNRIGALPRPGRSGPGASALALGLVLAWAFCTSLHAARIKDIAGIKGIRSNPLYGFGLVVGLAGTGGGGDFTGELARNVLLKLRVGRGLAELDSANLAAVIVTAELPPFARKGTAIDVTISALDESKSLRGGTLLLTPLIGADGEVYAVAQGPMSVGGFSFGGAAATVQQGHSTVGTIPGGAIVEKEVSTDFVQRGAITLCLETPDFTTATRIAEAINKRTTARASVIDPGTIRAQLAQPTRPDLVMRQISEIQTLEVTPDVKAIVIINERTGTVVAGQNVSISSVAVSHGNLTVITQELSQVSQPPALSSGTTITVPRTSVRILEKPLQEGGLTVLNRGATVSEVSRALNLLGASPRDIISIFQAMKKAGALHAELRVM